MDSSDEYVAPLPFAAHALTWFSACCAHAAKTHPPVDTGRAASPLPAFGNVFTAPECRLTKARPRGVAAATQPLCLPSVGGACSVTLPCKPMSAFPFGQNTLPLPPTTGVPPMTVNDSTPVAFSIRATSFDEPCGPSTLNTA